MIQKLEEDLIAYKNNSFEKIEEDDQKEKDENLIGKIQDLKEEINFKDIIIEEYKEIRYKFEKEIKNQQTRLEHEKEKHYEFCKQLEELLSKSNEENMRLQAQNHEFKDAITSEQNNYLNTVDRLNSDNS